jgi:hypothetical protein
MHNHDRIGRIARDLPESQRCPIASNEGLKWDLCGRSRPSCSRKAQPRFGRYFSAGPLAKDQAQRYGKENTDRGQDKNKYFKHRKTPRR